ncbi:MAG: hypothetical protein ACK4RM_03070 [Flavobacterium sp.]
MRYLFIFTLILLSSCKDLEVVKEEDFNEIDTLSISLVGADKDENGCLSTAGYTWSVLKQECVRLFEVAFVLPPIQSPELNDAVMVSYVLVSTDGLKAEVFFPGEEESIIFNRPIIGQPWTHESWTLIADEGFSLLFENTPKYKGDNEPGPKVIGTDRIED